MKKEIKENISKIAGHNTIFFTTRGNKAIKTALEYCKKKGFSKVMIQDQGGWITYKQFPEKMNLESIELKTDYGIIDLEDLSSKADEKSILLYANPAGYAAGMDMKKIYETCKEKGCIVICDISGGIGEKYIKGEYADIMICSMGRWKILDNKEGGFITFKKYETGVVDTEEPELDWKKIKEKFDKMPNRLEELKKRCSKIKQDLSDMDIIHKEKEGLVVIIRYSNDDEKNKIIKYCEENKLEWTECPKYIRVKENAISIEVKRLET